MRAKTTSFLNLIPAIVILTAVTFGCSKITNMMGGDKLYFCEKYVSATDNCEGESTKYTTGNLTVVVKLSKAIGATDVNINITDKNSGKVVDTKPYTVGSDKTYIYFDGVGFNDPGTYKVSLLKSDGTVIVSNDIEIVSK